MNIAMTERWDQEVSSYSMQRIKEGDVHQPFCLLFYFFGVIRNDACAPCPSRSSYGGL